MNSLCILVNIYNLSMCSVVHDVVYVISQKIELYVY